MTETIDEAGASQQCGAWAFECFCTLPKHPATEAHHCTNVGPFGVCGSMWRGEYETPTFEIIRLPLAGRLFTRDY